MRLERLAKDHSSGDKGCPGVHLDSEAGDLVIQGQVVDSRHLENVLPGEAAVRIKPEIVIEAMHRYQERG